MVPDAARRFATSRSTAAPSICIVDPVQSRVTSRAIIISQKNARKTVNVSSKQVSYNYLSLENVFNDYIEIYAHKCESPSLKVNVLHFGPYFANEFTDRSSSIQYLSRVAVHRPVVPVFRFYASRRVRETG